MIASSVKIVLASLLVLSMAVTISAQVCPNDYIVLPLANGAENPSRRLQEGAPPIQVIEQGGSYVDFVVQSSSAFMIEPEHLFVQYESGEFFSDNCLMFEGLELGEASTVMRASCVAGEYAVVWVHARSFTTLGLGSFEIPQCCPDPYGDSIPTSASTMKFAYELRCVPSCDDPVDNVSGAPSSSPSALPTELKLPRRALQEEIIKDMMPPSSSLCSPQTSTSTFEYQSSQAESQWYAPFAPLEEELFLAKMQHIDNNFNRSWTIRFGQAGNIYSMVGPMGETVPPQEHTNAPWVDEVWQAVQPLGPNGDHDNDLNTGPYFIHEAGTYTRDAPYTDKPFYSPTLGSYCNDGEGECGFASWGQQAHVPTLWKSPMLYLNRYVNCGDGVFEYTTLRHNVVGSTEQFGYMNVPWGGTRRSVLGDLVLTNKATQELEPVYPLDAWGAGKSKSLDATMGFTVFAQDLPKESNPLHDQPFTDLPSTLDLTIASQCFCENQCRNSSNRYVCPLVSQPSIGWTPNRGDPGLIVRLEGTGSGKSIVAGVRHWAGNTKLYFYQSDLLTLQKVQEALTVGFKVNVYHYYPPTGGREEDNLALGHVHGDFNGPGTYPRVRYGAAGRDYNVYTINDIPTIPAGSTYYYRQFFMMDAYTEMKGKGMLFSPEAIKATKGVGTIAGRTVKLYDSGANTFGFTVGDDTCRPAGAVEVCEGSTTPQADWKPVFEIYCGDSYAVTDDLYHFSPAGGTIRAYVCDGLDITIRPVWTLLGYFNVDGCSAIGSNYQFDAEYC